MSQNTPEAIIIPGLDEAYKAEDAPTSYALLEEIPSGTTFKALDIILQLVDATSDEVELMKRSLLEAREFGLVQSHMEKRIIPGTFFGLSPRDVKHMLSQIGGFDEEASFTHTHWNTRLDPLPSQGDLFNWGWMKANNPDLDCRVAFNQGNLVRAYRYLEKFDYKGTSEDPNS